MNIEGKRILVVGLGRTGLALARFLKAKAARVTVTDTATEKELKGNVQMLIDMGIHMELGQHQPESFTAADLILLSPGVPHTLEPIRKGREKGIPVLGELEFASRFIDQPMAAVTGTNGKTTTTALLGEMLNRSGMDVFVGGNIGNPLIGYVAEGQPAQVAVIEISSFQLDTIDTFKPRVAVLLNISEDHLDRYPDFNAYVESKGKIFQNQTPEDIAIINRKDSVSRRIVKGIRSSIWYVNAQPEEDGAVIEEDRIVFHTPVTGTLSLNLSDVRLSGRHNLENVAAACLAAFAMGGTIDGCRSALNAFIGLPHRQEDVAIINGVRYVNDSKATNVDAVQKALETYENPVILILGGRDKGGDFKRLIPTIQNKTKQVILTGEAVYNIAGAFGQEIRTESVSTIAAAVSLARNLAAPGDVVLLSPGCTSFDQYENYEERGEDFRRIVNALHKETA